MNHDVSLVLSSLRDYRFYERATIEPSWFGPTLSRVFLAIKECHEERPERLIPWKDISIKLRGKKAYSRISKLKTKGRGYSKTAQRRNLVKFLEYQMFSDMTEEMSKGIENGEKINHQDYIRKLEKIQQVASLSVKISDFFSSTIDDWQKEIEDIPVVGFPSEKLSKAFAGGMAGGHIITILAKTDGGKTTFAINTGRKAVQQGKVVLHCSFETPELELNQRYACSFTRHSWEWVVDHKKKLQAQLDKIPEHGGFLRIEDFSAVKASTIDIRVRAEKLKKDRDVLDLIIVDCGDDVESTRKYQSLREECKYVWNDLRRIGRRLNVPILVTTQANRAGAASDEVELIHIGESWGKATGSDGVISLITLPGESKALAVVLKTKRRGRYDRVPILFEREKCYIA